MKIPAIISMLSCATIAHGDPLLFSACAMVFLLIITSSDMGYRNSDWAKFAFSTSLSIVLMLFSPMLGALSLAYPVSVGVNIWRDNKIKNKLRMEVKSSSKKLVDLDEEPECDE